jgi:hypothetical protein
MPGTSGMINFAPKAAQNILKSSHEIQKFASHPNASEKDS